MFELAEDIKMPLPTSDYKTKLLELRNKVIHKGYKPTINEVNDYLNDEVLHLCEQLCNCKFESIKKMLSDNSFYSTIIR